MEPNPQLRLQPISIIFLIGAAALGFIFDSLLLTMTEDIGLSIVGFIGFMPMILVVAFLQDFAFQIRQEKVEFFNNQTPQQLTGTNFFVLAIAILIVIITVAVRQVSGMPVMNFWRYVFLMGASYLGTAIIRVYRKNHLQLT
jgi:hypothetical protein